MLLIPLAMLGLLSVASITATEVLIRTRVIPNDSFQWHLNMFQSSTSENAVFGDSHTSQGVHGLADFLNLSYPSDGVPTIEKKVELYFADKDPGKVILQADPNMFSRFRENRKPDYDVRLFASPSRFRLWMFTGLHRNNVIEYWKLFFQRSSFKNNATFHSDGSMTLTESWMDVPENQRQDDVSGSLSSRYWPDKVPHETENGRSYERMLSFLASRKAVVCMVGMPIAPKFSRFIADSPYDPMFDRAQDYFQILAAEYNVRYVDLSTAITMDALFRDPHHLNEAGALEFAPLLETACFGSSSIKQP